MGKDRLYTSGVALRAGETYNNQIRTSQGTFLSSGGRDDNVLGRIERRAAEVTMLHWALGEVRSWWLQRIGCMLHVAGQVCLGRCAGVSTGSSSVGRRAGVPLLSSTQHAQQLLLLPALYSTDAALLPMPSSCSSAAAHDATGSSSARMHASSDMYPPSPPIHTYPHLPAPLPPCTLRP